MKTYTDRHGREWIDGKHAWLLTGHNGMPWIDVIRACSGKWVWVNILGDSNGGYKTVKLAMDATHATNPPSCHAPPRRPRTGQFGPSRGK